MASFHANWHIGRRYIYQNIEYVLNTEPGMLLLQNQYKIHIFNQENTLHIC